MIYVYIIYRESTAENIKAFLDYTEATRWIVMENNNDDDLFIDVLELIQ